MLTRGKLLLVDYRVEYKKWDRRFGFSNVGLLFLDNPNVMHHLNYIKHSFFSLVSNVGLLYLTNQSTHM